MTFLKRLMLKTVQKHFPKQEKQTFMIDYQGVDFIRADLVEYMLEDIKDE
jgi:hypothetical protein